MERPQTVIDALRALGIAEPRRLRKLTTLEIAALFRGKGAAHLWVSDDFGDVRQRVAPDECFAFWKSELNGRVLEEPGFAREHWPGGYAYFVSEWTSPFDAPLLELRRCA
jgi:hypothetical protein